MNIAKLTLSLYMRNPASESWDGMPLILLANGKRLVVEMIDYEVTTIEDDRPRWFTTYRVHREYDPRGFNRHRIADCTDLQDVVNIIAIESGGVT